MKYYFLILVLPFAAWSRDLSYEKRMALIMKARSKSEIINISKQLGHYEDLKSECRLQLQMEQVPVKCFQQLKIEQQLKLVKPRQVDETRQLLARICDLRVDNLTDVSTIKQYADEMDPQLECSKRLKERIRRREYQEIEAAPLELFEAVHKT